jgi:hypothetical protein
MSEYRKLYLAKFRGSLNKRAYFGLFIPNATDTDKDPLEEQADCLGTVIYVVSDPSRGYHYEFKRNYQCYSSTTLEKLVHLDYVRSSDVYDP